MISVIIPAYNAQEHLAESIRSVLAQSFTDYELIVVDDGSTDHTAAIAMESARGDGRLQLLQKSNGGLADARNYGVRHARGEWVTFLDSDDCLYPEALSVLAEVVHSSGCDIVTAGFRRGEVYDPVQGTYIRDFKLLNATEAVEHTLYQRSGMYPSACAKLYRRSLFDSLSFTAGTWYEDLDFFYKAYLRAGKVAVTRSQLYFYRSNPSSFLSRFTPARLDVLRVTENMERFMEQHHPGLLPAARDRRLSANFNMLALMLISPHPQDYAAEIAECRELIGRYRWRSLLNPRVRLKNKAGILAGCLGTRAFTFLSRIIYRPASGRRVITVTTEEFTGLCRLLASKVIASGYTPDIIVAIYRGGDWVAKNMGSDLGGIPLVDVNLSRPISKWKSPVKGMFKLLPYRLLDRMRLMESKLLSMCSHKLKDGVVIPPQLAGNRFRRILVVDDSVDSGATLASVIAALRRAAPDAECRSAVLTVTTAAPLVHPNYTLYDNLTLIRFPWSMDMKK